MGLINFKSVFLISELVFLASVNKSTEYLVFTKASLTRYFNLFQIHETCYWTMSGVTERNINYLDFSYEAI